MESVTFEYDGTLDPGLCIAHITAAVPGVVYRFNVNDNDSANVDATAVGTTLDITIPDIGGTPAGTPIRTRVWRLKPPGNGTQIGATILNLGTPGEYGFYGVWAYDGANTVTFTFDSLLGVTYRMGTLDNSGAASGSSGNVAGTGSSLILTAVAPGDFFDGFIGTLSIPAGDDQLSVRLFHQGVAGAGELGNPPGTVVALSPINVGSSSATFRGTANPGGLESYVNFEYGTTTSYGSATTQQFVGGGTSDVPVSTPVSGLLPDRDYHYRLLLNFGSGSTPPDPPPATTGGHHIGLKQYTNYNDATWGYDRYDHLIFGEWAANGAAAALTKPVLGYVSAASIRNDYWTCMDINYARSNGWLLTHGGTEIYNAGYPAAKIGDIGDAAFSNAWASSVIARASAGGWDGVFIDDVTRASVESGFTNTTPDAYPSQSDWEDAMVQHIDIVCAALTSANLYSMVNAAGFVSGSSGWDNGNDTKAFFTRLKTHISAFMVEYWMQRGDGSGITRGSGTGAWYNNWEGWLSVIPHVEAGGVDFAGLSELPPGDSTDALYVKASTLLEVTLAGSAMYLDADRNGGQNPFGTKVCKDMGNPLGAKYAVGSNWQRDFDNGTIIVNPVAKTATIP